jgi:hypothetical protein
MAGFKIDSHRYNARWIIASFSGIDAHGRRFGKGERVFYYPALGEIVSGKRAEQAELLSIADIPAASPR